MKRIVLVFALAVCGLATPVFAQVIDDGYLQGTIGANTSGKTGVALAVEGGGTVAAKLEAFAELGWTSNIEPEGLKANASTIAGFLEQTTGQPAGYKADTPTFHGTVGVRYFLGPTAARIRPYVLTSVGFATIDRQVTFSVAGKEVAPGDVGVTLGDDLDGSATSATFGGGGGALFAVSSLTFDVGVRYARVFTAREGTNSTRFQMGVRYKF